MLKTTVLYANMRKNGGFKIAGCIEMKVLVIGGNRFIGKNLVYDLIKNGYSVTIATRGKTEDPFGDSVKRIVFNRLDESSIKSNLSEEYFDVVFDSLAYCSNNVKILLNHIRCGRYVMISTTAVYKKHMDTKEDEFNPFEKELIWCGRNDFPYDVIKRQAECALFQHYSHIKSVAVRFPFVIGEDDYTKRLFFYVEHVLNRKPMFIDNYEKQMAFVRSDEAGKFLASFAANDFTGQINGASDGTISVKDIAEYVEGKTGTRPILFFDGEKAPYNGETEYSINTDKAKQLGFQFSPLKTWIYELIDYYIAKAENSQRI